MNTYIVRIDIFGFASIVCNNITICLFADRAKGPSQAAEICDLLNNREK
jgi:hypothetical protein